MIKDFFEYGEYSPVYICVIVSERLSSWSGVRSFVIVAYVVITGSDLRRHCQRYQAIVDGVGGSSDWAGLE